MTLDAQVRLARDGFTLEARLEVPAGQVVAVLGPNGAGKTTLLRVLAGLLPTRDSRVSLQGRVLDDGSRGIHTPPPARRVGVVFQDYRLFPHLSALENVAFGPRSTGAAKQQARAEALDWLTRLGVADQAQHRPAALSGGQAQRVALARALCGSPDLLLLDEPLAALDVDTRASVRLELAAQLAAFAGPAVLVTHDPIEALTLADRLVVLEGGRVVQEGPVEVVARRPATPYTARLVGLNLLEGEARGGEVALVGGGRLIVPDPSLSGPVLAVIAPNAVHLHRSAPVAAAARNCWQGRITSLEALGGRVRAAVEGAPSLLVDLTAQAVAELRLSVGEVVWLTVKATEVDVYPASGSGAFGPAPAGIRD